MVTTDREQRPPSPATLALAGPALHARVVDALEQNLWDLWSRFGRGDDCRLHAEDDATWFDTPIPTLPYNAVIRFSAREHVDLRIDRLFAHYHQRGVPFLWILHPTAQPPDLAARLAARGLVEAEVCPGMSMALDDLPPIPATPDAVTIGEVMGDTDAARLLELVAWRWHVPAAVLPRLAGVTRAFEVGSKGGAVRAWIASREGVPMAKAVLNLSAGVAGLYGVSTRPEARGLGLARRLTLQALHEARLEGCTRAVLHSTPGAQSLYARIGFRVYAPFRIFAPPQLLHM